MPVDRPIFILGPPRCGTTLLYECLTSHPDVGFFNRANRKLTELPRLAHWLTQARVFRDTPRESRAIWDRWRPDRPYDDDLMTRDDVTDEIRSWYHRLVHDVSRLRGTKRFAAKLPSHSARVDWIDAVFPDAIFVQAIRDWRSAVSSTVIKRERDFNGNWFGVMLPGWKEASRDPAAMGAAWQFVEVHERLARDADKFGERFHQVHYEDLCTDPKGTMETLCSACDLPWDQGFSDRLPKIREMSEIWRKTLHEQDLNAIEERFGDRLNAYNRGAHLTS